LKDFDDLGLAKSLLESITKEGYSKPTPIQEKAIPVMLAGRDLFGIAQTGTGKTAAFVLPILNQIAEEPARPQPKHCRAIVIAPTRELAAQILESVRTYGRELRHSAALVVGGNKHGPQIRTLSRGVDVVVATPGRLLDHLNAGVLSLSATTTVVLDEADQMLDMGFVPDIKRILSKLPKEHQTVLFSATMPKPIKALANEFLVNPAEISVAAAATPIEKISQEVVLVEKSLKRRVLVTLFKDKDFDRSIVFTRTKRGADQVQGHLVKAGLSAAAIHGDKSQGQRDRALKDFKTNKVSIMVATDIAARGIDIDDCSHVVNFDLPNVPESYVHRIGRTARAGRSGIALTLCDPSEYELLDEIEQLIKKSIKKQKVKKKFAVEENAADEFEFIPLTEEEDRDRWHPGGAKKTPTRSNRKPSNHRKGGGPKAKVQARGADRPKGAEGAKRRVRKPKPGGGGGSAGRGGAGRAKS
jgi:ATP-dependent RNA helicase RhlE